MLVNITCTSEHWQCPFLVDNFLYSYQLPAWDVLIIKRNWKTLNRHLLCESKKQMNSWIWLRPVNCVTTNQLMEWLPSRLALYSLVDWKIIFFASSKMTHSKCSKTSILLNKMLLMSDVTEHVFDGSWCMHAYWHDLPFGFGLILCLH